MMKRSIHTSSQRGVTLIELAAAMTITAAIVVGLAGGVISIVGYYQDDWVRQEIRRYALTSMDMISDYIEDATHGTWSRAMDTGFDLVTLSYNKSTKGNLIQGDRDEGFYYGPNLMIDFMTFPKTGQYRMTGQRIVELHHFQCRPRKDIEGIKGSSTSAMRLVNRSVWDITIGFSMTTIKQDYTEVVEYLTFHSQVFAPRM